MGDIGMAEKSGAKAPSRAPSKHDIPAPAGAADSGVGTGVEAPKDETVRGQSRMHIGAGHVAAPIEAPDAANQTDPAEGHARSSSNPVGGVTGVRTQTGENHVRFVDESGNEVSADDLFEPHGENQNSRIVKQSVYEVFNYPGSQAPMSRRLFYKGQRIDLHTAARVADAAALGEAQTRQEADRLKAEDKAFYAATPDKA